MHNNIHIYIYIRIYIYIYLVFCALWWHQLFYIPNWWVLGRTKHVYVDIYIYIYIYVYYIYVYYIYIYIWFLSFWCYIYPKFFMSFLHILQWQSFGLQCLIFCLKMFKLSAFFNSAGKSFQMITPIVQSLNQICSFLCFVYSRRHQILDCINYFHLNWRYHS